MKPEQQAQQLADWLDAHPGTEPPADLDPEVIEATYVLRPDLAPAARVTVDDILSGIIAGPFLDSSGGYATEDEVQDDHAPTQPVWVDDDYASEDEVEDNDHAPTQPVWADDEYASEAEVDNDHAPTQPVWADDDYATDDEVDDDDGSPTELASRLSGSATPKPAQSLDASSPTEALDASSPMEALDASSPMEALDASSPMEASDQEPPTKASVRSSEERQNDAAAKARARLSVLPSPAERAKLDAEKEAAESRRRRRAFWARSTGGLALAAVVVLAMKSVVLAPSDNVSPEEPTAVSSGERIFEDKEDGVQAQLEPMEEAVAEGEAGPEALAKPEAEPPMDLDPGFAAGGRATASREAGEEQEAKKKTEMAQPSPRPRPAPAPAAMTRPAPQPAYAVTGSDPAPDAAPAPTAAPAAASPPPAPPAELAAATTHTTRGGAPAGGSTGGLVASKDEAEPLRLEDANDAVADLDGLAFDAADNGGAELSEAEEELDDAMGYAADGDARSRVAKESATVTEAVVAKSPRGQDRKRRDRKSDVAAESAPATAELTTAADTPAQAPDLRAAAYPSDLPSTPAGPSSTALAEYRIANTAADAYMNTGQPREAADQLRQQVATPSDIGMANAARAAEIYLSIGAWSDAAGVSRSGLALSAKNTPWRSLLFVRLGDALRGLGDEAGAAEAYRSAIALNTAR